MLSVHVHSGGKAIQNTSFMFVIPGAHIWLLSNGNDFHLGVLREGWLHPLWEFGNMMFQLFYSSQTVIKSLTFITGAFHNIPQSQTILWISEYFPTKHKQWGCKRKPGGPHDWLPRELISFFVWMRNVWVKANLSSTIHQSQGGIGCCGRIVKYSAALLNPASPGKI